ncbi:MAG: OmpA family protein [Bacteroidota bacterium]
MSLGTNLNTNQAEYLPSFTADGETLIYTRVVRGQEDFYYSTMENGEWLAGLPLTAINTPASEGAQSISANGKIMVFTACSRKDGLGECDLYYSEVRNNRWTPPANMGEPINTRGWESQPALSADGSILYFASRRPGGLGSIDIWRSERKADGKWTEPINVGAPINTPMEDKAPFLHHDGQTLYFMSEGHPGMGGHDLYLSRKNTDGSWSEPKNLGYPINTKGHEGALVISLDGRKAYFSTNQKYTETDEGIYSAAVKGNETDIYSFDLYEDVRPLPVTYVKATVKDAETKKALVASVEFVDLATGQVQANAYTDKEGEFLVCLPLGKDYALNVAKKQYLFHSENFALSNNSQLDKPYLLDIALQPIKLDVATDQPSEVTAAKPVVLKNVFFDTGSNVLQSTSFIELQKLAQLLKENTTLRIQINGHTDDVGSDTDNQKLSENRAKAVYQYLLEQGIPEGQLSYKGFGETQPIADNTTEAGKQANRRTEFIIIR